MFSSAQSDERVQWPGVAIRNWSQNPPSSTNLNVLVGVEIRVENNYGVCCSKIDSRCG